MPISPSLTVLSRALEEEKSDMQEVFHFALLVAVALESPLGSMQKDNGYHYHMLGEEGGNCTHIVASWSKS